LFVGVLVVVAGLSAADSTPKAAKSERLMSARNGACAALLPDGRILIAGGQANKTTLASTELFSVRNGTTAGATMTSARMDHACAALPNGMVLAAGGTAVGGGALNTAELYDPATGAWAAWA